MALLMESLVGALKFSQLGMKQGLGWPTAGPEYPPCYLGLCGCQVKT